VEQVSGGVAAVFHNDRLGSAERITDLAGNVTGRVEYDEWGKPSVITPGLEPNYTGYEYDQTLEIYYAKARFYDPVTTRMLSEEPIGLGINHYAYCDNNPVSFIDPFGLEKIVVTGGSDGAENFIYNFIETSILQIRHWKYVDFYNSNESIGWIIAKFNYSEDDIKAFQTVAKNYGVSLTLIEDKQDLFKYMNKPGREDDLISEMSFFAHGTAFDVPGTVDNTGYKNQYAVALGYSEKARVPHNNNLNIFLSDLENINSSAFTEDYFAFFGSCRTGNDFDGISFAQEWANKTNGTVKAAEGSNGRTDYKGIFPDDRNIIQKVLDKLPFWDIKAKREIAREKYGFSERGSINYPVPTNDSEWKIFTPEQ
jgi:RHS repeat-associated protein